MKLLEVELLTDNIIETKKFYAETLGFPILNQSPKSISFLVKNSTLTFTKSEHVKPNYHFAFNIPNNKLEEAITWATAKFNLIKNSDNELVTKFEDWKAESIYFYDNNKNILELIARFDLNNSSEDPFHTTSIESISEIAIVADHPLILSEEIIKSKGLNYFSKGPRRDDFTVLGNDEGLILIAKTNRSWYPTNDPAEKRFTRIKFSIDNKSKELTINENI